VKTKIFTCAQNSQNTMYRNNTYLNSAHNNVAKGRLMESAASVIEI